MKSRVDVSSETVDRAVALMRTKLLMRLDQKGWDSFIGPHEILGILEEERMELTEAVRSDDWTEVVDELLDLAVGAVFGIASIMAIADTKAKEPLEPRSSKEDA